MNRLDAVVGPSEWSTAYLVRDDAAKAIECQISVRYGSDWITKADVGYPNEASDATDPGEEPLKAAYSDAFKRACVQHGVGRYLYSLELEQDWMDVDERGHFKERPRVKGSIRQAQDASLGTRQERPGAVAQAAAGNHSETPATPPSNEGVPPPNAGAPATNGAHGPAEPILEAQLHALRKAGQMVGWLPERVGEWVKEHYEVPPERLTRQQAGEAIKALQVEGKF